MDFEKAKETLYWALMAHCEDCSREEALRIDEAWKSLMDPPAGLEALVGREVTVLSHANTEEGHTVTVTQHGPLESLRDTLRPPYGEEHEYRVQGRIDGVEFSADNVLACHAGPVPVIII